MLDDCLLLRSLVLILWSLLHFPLVLVVTSRSAFNWLVLKVVIWSDSDYDPDVFGRIDM
jgi:hypothetical protein